MVGVFKVLDPLSRRANRRKPVLSRGCVIVIISYGLTPQVLVPTVTQWERFLLWWAVGSGRWQFLGLCFGVAESRLSLVFCSIFKFLRNSSNLTFLLWAPPFFR